MATFTRFHTARKQYRCIGSGIDTCRRTIEPGDRYARVVATPDHDGMGNERWWRLRECLPCAAFYGHPDPAAVTS